MKILVVSDSHRYNDILYEVIKYEAPLDMVIHCGDAEGAEYAIESAAGCKLEIVQGNNDFFTSVPLEREFEIMGKRFFVAHGHYYYVSMGAERFIEEAVSRKVDIALFGHTHRPYLKNVKGMLVMNPGSISYPRQEGREPSYAIIYIEDDGKVRYEHKFLKK